MKCWRYQRCTPLNFSRGMFSKGRGTVVIRLAVKYVQQTIQKDIQICKQKVRKLAKSTGSSRSKNRNKVNNREGTTDGRAGLEHGHRLHQTDRGAESSRHCMQFRTGRGYGADEEVWGCGKDLIAISCWRYGSTGELDSHFSPLYTGSHPLIFEVRLGTEHFI